MCSAPLRLCAKPDIQNLKNLILATAKDRKKRGLETPDQIESIAPYYFSRLSKKSDAA